MIPTTDNQMGWQKPPFFRAEITTLTGVAILARNPTNNKIITCIAAGVNLQTDGRNYRRSSKKDQARITRTIYQSPDEPETVVIENPRDYRVNFRLTDHCQDALKYACGQEPIYTLLEMGPSSARKFLGPGKFNPSVQEILLNRNWNIRVDSPDVRLDPNFPTGGDWLNRFDLEAEKLYRSVGIPTAMGLCAEMSFFIGGMTRASINGLRDAGVLMTSDQPTLDLMARERAARKYKVEQASQMRRPKPTPQRARPTDNNVGKAMQGLNIPVVPERPKKPALDLVNSKPKVVAPPEALEAPKYVRPVSMASAIEQALNAKAKREPMTTPPVVVATKEEPKALSAVEEALNAISIPPEETPAPAEVEEAPEAMSVEERLRQMSL